MNRLLAVCLLLFFTRCVFAQSDSLDTLLFHRSEYVLPFADYLFCEGDYFRASLEYAKINSPSDTVLLKSAICFYAIDRYDFADSLTAFITEPSLQVETGFLRTRSHFLNENFSAVINSKSACFDSSDIRTERIESLALLKLNMKEDLVSKSKLFFNDTSAFANLISMRDERSEKSPLVAGLLSALLPGAGKIYTGFTGDGITALLVTGLFAYLTYYNIDAGNGFKSYLFGSLGTLFYAGNIYGSVVSAGYRNNLDQKEWDAAFERLAGEYAVPLDESIKKWCGGK